MYGSRPAARRADERDGDGLREPEARDLANTPEAKALPAEIQGLMKAGMAFTDAAGNITADFEIIDQALKDWTEGLTIPDVAEWAKTVERQVSAQFQLMDIQSVVNRNLAIPLSQAMQRISSPYLPAGAGLVPNAAAISEGQKYRSGMEAQYGLSGTNWVKGISAGEYEAFLGGKPTVSFGKGGAATFGSGLGLPAWAAQEAAGYMTRATELQAQQEIANKKAIDDAYQMILNQPGGRTMYGPPAPGQTIEPGNADQYKTLMGSAQTASKELAGLQARAGAPGPGHGRAGRRRAADSRRDPQHHAPPPRQRGERPFPGRVAPETPQQHYSR